MSIIDPKIGQEPRTLDLDAEQLVSGGEAKPRVLRHRGASLEVHLGQRQP